MPQMMPCSWIFVFFLSSVVLFFVNVMWANFFLLKIFPFKEKESLLSESFWV